MEIDAGLLNEDRAKGVSDEDILQTLIKDSGGTLSVGEYTIDLNAALESGDSVSSILDFITSGKPIRTDIDTGVEAGMAGAATGMTNFLGTPVDLVNMGLQAGESLVRSGINKLGGDVSNDPNDYLLSSPNPIGGGQSIRDGIEAASMGTIDYVDSAEEIREDLRPQFQAGRVVGENLPAAGGVLLAAKAGVGLANPLIKEAADNTSKFVKTELAATTGAAGGAATAEALDFGDNPYVMAGAEILGALTGANASTLSKVSPTRVVTGIASRLGKQIWKGLSDDAARNGALEQIVLAADGTRKGLLKEADLAEQSGDTALAESLRQEAEMFTIERMVSDIETALAVGGNVAEAVGNLPAGSLTDNPTLAGIQKAMMGESAQFGGEVMDRANQAILGILEVSELLSRAGNTKAAEVLRTRAYAASIDATIKNAEGNTQEAMKVLKGTDKGAASALAQKTLFNAKTNIRDMETYLWDRVDKSQTVDASELAATIDAIQNGKLLQGMTIAGGGQIDDAINIVRAKINNGQPITVGELLKFRSVMLGQSRKAGAAEDFFQAGLFDELAGAAIDQLNNLEGVSGDTIDLARKFSLELNKRFTRYFTKDVLSTESLGGTTIREQDVLPEGFGSGGDPAATKFGELREAAEFSDEMAPNIQTIKDQDLQAEFDKFARGIGAEPPDITMPAELTGPSTTLPSTKTTPDPDRMSPTERPAAGELNQAQQAAELLFRFAKKMEAEGRMDLAEEARRRAQAFDQYRGPQGEEYFDPKATQPEAEPVDDFQLNEGGDTTSVAFPADPQNVSLGQTMSEAQQDFLRATVADMVDLNGNLDLNALEAFMQKNQRLINEFPNLREEIVSMHDAIKTSDRLIAELGQAKSSERLPEVIGQALDGSTPVESYSRLANEAASIEAKTDFRNATMDEVFRGAVKTDGSPDLLKVAERLMRPVTGRSGDPNVLDVMVQNGILGGAERDSILELVAEGLRIEKGIRDPKVFDKVMADTPDIQKNLARILGANIGVLFGRGDASLQAASIGSGMLKRYIDQFPLGKQAEEMQILLKQPKLLLTMLQAKGPMQKTAFQTAKEYSTKVRELGLSGGARMVGGAIADNLATTNTAYPSALTGNTQDEADPTITIDNQMMNLLPDVDVPTMYPSAFLDEEGNPR
ncbi:hypothetical protein CRP738_gp20 [Roseobacter phage CRP-738]|nr:hypothetical protein CRP738_gp20 [Roseobacter phage CRP-738]